MRTRLPQWLVACGVALLVWSAASAGARPAHPRPTTCPAHRWVENWYAAPSDSDSIGDGRLQRFTHGPGQTLRMVITPHLGGSLIRLRFSNLFGSSPLTIDAAGIARDAGSPTSTSADLVTGTQRAIRFSGQTSVTIPAGGSVVSDATPFTFQAFENLAVSLYLASAYATPTEHFSGRQISYATEPLAGDQVANPSGASFTQTTTARYLLAGLDVLSAGDAGTVVTFGDSITDGYQGPPSLVPENSATLNLNARYPDFLARRILAAHLPLAVANAGISGNRILQDGQIPMFGPSGVSRFRRDVLDVPGVSTVIILEGTNDIGQSNATPAQIEAGLARLVAMARGAHLRVLLGTLTPMGSASQPGYGGAAPNATREAVNRWIRAQHLADGVIDFATAVADPADPADQAPAANGGDGLHFTPAGYQAMANAVDLRSLAGPACRLATPHGHR